MGVPGRREGCSAAAAAAAWARHGVRRGLRRRDERSRPVGF